MTTPSKFDDYRELSFHYKLKEFLNQNLRDLIPGTECDLLAQDFMLSLHTVLDEYQSENMTNTGT